AEGPTLAPMSRLLARSLLTWDSAMSARSSASSSSCCTFRNLDRLLVLQLPHPGLQLLQLLLAALEGDLLGLIQPVLEVLDGLLHVLLHALQVVVGAHRVVQLDLGVLQTGRGLVAAACLRVQRGLQRVHHPQVVALGLLHLLLLLRQLALDLRLDLVELQLGAQDLALLVLQGGLAGGGERGSQTHCQGTGRGGEGGQVDTGYQPGLQLGKEGLREGAGGGTWLPGCPGLPLSRKGLGPPTCQDGLVLTPHNPDLLSIMEKGEVFITTYANFIFVSWVTYPSVKKEAPKLRALPRFSKNEQ
uniref:Uncharacterized protein n=1 Tax=Ursus maritimus TaxID=29073 RepID=A0A452UG84_URSMA